MSWSIITATGKNGEIGRNGDLIWRIPEDLYWFKYHTTNKVVIMGRNTYESLPVPYLPKRINIVLTSDRNYKPHENVMVRHSVQDILHEFASEREVMVMGGSKVYKDFLPYCNRIYLTKVNHTFDADTYLPDVNWDDWMKYFSREGTDKSEYDYSFHIYKKPLK